MRLSRIEPGALIASILGHLGVLAASAWWFGARSSAGAGALEEISVALVEPATPAPGGSSGASLVPVPEETPEPPRAGGSPQIRPDAGDPGRGGSREGARATNLSSSVDPLTLEREVPNHLEQSEVQRLRVAAERRSRDDRRATPGPMQLDFVASGLGNHRLRRPVARLDPSRGAALGGPSVRSGTAPGSRSYRFDSGHTAIQSPGSKIPGGEPKPAQGADTLIGSDHRPSAPIVHARPALVRDRAAVPAEERDRPRDTVDSRQRVAARVPSLMQSSTLGGEAPDGSGGQAIPSAAFPAVGATTAGTGARSVPVGNGLGTDLSPAPDLQTYYSALLARLDRAVKDAFPRWAIAEGRGGLVVFDLTLREDGSVASVALVRPSGIDEYDQNVLDGVRSVGSFGRIPQELAARPTLRINLDSQNPVVGRSGAGPGQRPR